jgi:hypothetical protein
MNSKVKESEKSKIILNVLQVTHVMKVSAGRQNFSPPSAMNKKNASCLGEIQRLQRVRSIPAAHSLIVVSFYDRFISNNAFNDDGSNYWEK